MGGRYSPERRERELERPALGPFRRKRDKRQRTLREGLAFGRAQMEQRGFGGLGVVAHRDQGLVAALEVHRELRDEDWDARCTFAFERGADLAMELRAGRRRGPLVEHLPEKRVPERVRQLARIGAALGAGRREPQLLARERIANLADPLGLALKRPRDRADTELDAAHGRR